jgi:NADH:ubiquinone oxidoreductase subunit 6 (subunit J)
MITLFKVIKKQQNEFKEVFCKYLFVLFVQNAFFYFSYSYGFFDLISTMVLVGANIYLFLSATYLLITDKKLNEENNKLFGKIQFNYHAYVVVWGIMIAYVSSNTSTSAVTWIEPSVFWTSAHIICGLLFYYFSEHVNDIIARNLRN